MLMPELISTTLLAALLVNGTTSRVSYVPPNSQETKHGASANFYAIERYAKYLCSKRDLGCLKRLEVLAQELIDSDSLLAVACN